MGRGADWLLRGCTDLGGASVVSTGAARSGGCRRVHALAPADGKCIKRTTGHSNAVSPNAAAPSRTTNPAAEAHTEGLAKSVDGSPCAFGCRPRPSFVARPPRCVACVR